MKIFSNLRNIFDALGPPQSKSPFRILLLLAVRRFSAENLLFLKVLMNHSDPAAWASHSDDVHYGLEGIAGGGLHLTRIGNFFDEKKFIAIVM